MLMYLLAYIPISSQVMRLPICHWEAGMSPASKVRPEPHHDDEEVKIRREML